MIGQCPEIVSNLIILFIHYSPVTRADILIISYENLTTISLKTGVRLNYKEKTLRGTTARGITHPGLNNDFKKFVTVLVNSSP